MLFYDKEIYNRVLSNCINNEINTFVEIHHSKIIEYSKSRRIDESEVQKHIRLHLPQFKLADITTDYFFDEHLVPLLDYVLSNYVADLRSYHQDCGFSDISRYEKLKLKGANIIEIQNDKIIHEVEVFNVSELNATFIENSLHYLHSFRQDATYRFGLFLKGHPLPICYMSFCKIDRRDKLKAIIESLSLNNLDPANVIELSRVFGCGRLPHNTISFLVSCATKHFRELGYEYMITAVNPYLGFCGTSMIASAFSPFAVRPVHYQYSAHTKEYLTIRSSEKVNRSEMKMPPNILYIKEIQKKGKKAFVKMIINITEKETYMKPIIEKDIYSLRGSLEKVWNDETRYHGTHFHSSDHPSKGQCGVSSMHLARHLQSQGYEVKFCEGDVFFPESDKSITNHCWIKLLNLREEGSNSIIDITADQNGYKEKVIFKTELELKAEKIMYVSTSECNVEEVGVEHLIDRLLYLENVLQQSN